MANSGFLEYIGFRAVIQDVRQFQADGRTLERTGTSIAANMKALEANTVSLAAAQAKLIAVNAKLAATTVGRQRNALGQFVAQTANPMQAQWKKESEELQKTVNKGLAEELSLNKKINDEKAKAKTLQRERFDRATTTAALGTVGIGAIIGGAAISAAAKYETTLTKIDNFTNLTSEDTKELGERILQLSKNIPKSPEELGASAYFALSSGINDVNTALDLATVAAKLSVASGADIADTTKNLTNILVAYGTANITAAQAADILTVAIREGTAEPADFAAEMGRLVGLASNLNVPFDQLAATFANLTNVLNNPSQAATGLLGILNQLASPGKEARKELERLHYPIEQIYEDITKKGFAETLKILAERLGNISDTSIAFPDVRGLNSFLIAFKNNGDQVLDTLDKMSKSTGSFEDAFQKARKTTASQVQLLKNQFTVALIQIGEKLLPEVNNGLSELNTNFGNSSSSVQSLVAEGLGDLLKILIDIVGGLAQVGKGFNELQNSLAGIAGQGAAAKVQMAAVGAALAWALPGGAIIKGLLIIAGIMGELNRNQTSISNSISNALGLPNSSRGSDKVTAALEGRFPERDLTALNLPGGASTVKQLMDSYKASKEGMINAGKSAEEMALKLPGLNKELGGAGDAADEAAKDFHFLADTLAGEALKAVQAAQSALFGRPTQERARAELAIARAAIPNARLHDELEPLIDALQEQTKALKEASEAQIDVINDQIDAIQKQSDKQKEALENQIEGIETATEVQEALYEVQLENIEAQKEQNNLLREQADALDAQIDGIKAEAAQRKLNLQEQIVALQGQTPSTAAQKKSNNAQVISLQGQRNLVDYQTDARVTVLTTQSNALKKAAEDLEDNYDKQAKAIEKNSDLLEKNSEAQVEAIEKQIEAIEKNTDSQTEALENQIDFIERATEAQERALEQEESALEKRLSASDKELEALNNVTKYMDLEIELMKAELAVADKSLLTQEELQQHFEELIRMTGEASEGYRLAAEKTKFDLIPAFDEARKALKDMRENGVDTLKSSLEGASGAAGAFSSALGDATEKVKTDASSAHNEIASAVASAAGTMEAWANVVATNGGDTLASAIAGAIADFEANKARAISQTFGNGPPIVLGQFDYQKQRGSAEFAEGGIVTRPTLSTIGERGWEAVLPLNDPARSREILSSIPPSILAGMMTGRGGSSNVYQIGNISLPNVQNGYQFFDELEAYNARQLRLRKAGV